MTVDEFMLLYFQTCCAIAPYVIVTEICSRVIYWLINMITGNSRRL